MNTAKRALAAGVVAAALLVAPMGLSITTHDNGAQIKPASNVSTAYAKPKTPVDNGVRCVSEEVDSIDFYLPGEIVTTIDSNGVGHRLQCGEDGEWHPVSRVSNDSRLPRAPQGGVFSASR